jgi:hypothetical protein
MEWINLVIQSFSDMSHLNCLSVMELNAPVKRIFMRRIILYCTAVTNIKIYELYYICICIYWACWIFDAEAFIFCLVNMKTSAYIL